MIRTVISLDPEDRKWLGERTRAEHVSVAELIRHAIAHHRDHTSPDTEETLSRLFEETAGIWKEGGGLEHQQRVRGHALYRL